ncbi:MAG: hypothetical protein ACREX9_23725 [Gammaproteobacteria bacterium]
MTVLPADFDEPGDRVERRPRPGRARVSRREVLRLLTHGRDVLTGRSLVDEP